MWRGHDPSPPGSNRKGDERAGLQVDIPATSRWHAQDWLRGSAIQRQPWAGIDRCGSTHRVIKNYWQLQGRWSESRGRSAPDWAPAETDELASESTRMKTLTLLTCTLLIDM
jgi:hypothetical protein